MMFKEQFVMPHKKIHKSLLSLWLITFVSCNYNGGSVVSQDRTSVEIKLITKMINVGKVAYVLYSNCVKKMSIFCF